MRIIISILLLLSFNLQADDIYTDGYNFVNNSTNVWVNTITNVDISMYTAITVTMDWGEIGAMENADRFRFQYKLDPPGPWITVTSQKNDICGGVCPGNGTSINISGLEGDLLRIRVRAKNNNNNETWWWDNLIVAGTPIPLPVELLYFKAKSDDTIITFTWATGSEVNNDFFTIQESVDAFNYVGIHFIAGAGNSSSKIDYTIPIRVENSNNYYRLKQVDFDGTTTYSEIIKLNYKEPDKHIIGIFDINYKQVNYNTKGLVIIRYNDGTVRKQINR